MAELGNRREVLGSHALPIHAVDGCRNLRGTAFRRKDKIPRREDSNRLILLGDDEDGGSSRHHERRGISHRPIVLDKLNRSGHDGPNLDITRLKPLCDDFLDDVRRRHEPELRFGVFYEQAWHPFTLQQGRCFGHRHISGNLNHAWCHHMCDHGDRVILRLEILIILIQHSSARTPLCMNPPSWPPQRMPSIADESFGQGRREILVIQWFSSIHYGQILAVDQGD